MCLSLLWGLSEPFVSVTRRVGWIEMLLRTTMNVTDWEWLLQSFAIIKEPDIDSCVVDR